MSRMVPSEEELEDGQHVMMISGFWCIQRETFDTGWCAGMPGHKWCGHATLTFDREDD